MSTDRSDYTRGLRALADLLDNDPDFPLPYNGTQSSALLWIIGNRDGQDAAWQRDFLRRFARAVDGPATKDYRDDSFDLAGRLHGLHLTAIAERDAVCERVATTREVTREVPDPAVVIPTVTVTETVEDVTWECGSLLADTDAPKQATA